MAKKLLNEAVVRRFQSLANIKPINEMRSSIEEEKMEETVEAVEETIEERMALKKEELERSPRHGSRRRARRCLKCQKMEDG